MNANFLDLSISFFCRTSHKGKDGMNPIVLRLSYRGARKDLFTGLHCQSNDWDNGSQRVYGRTKTGANTNKHLDEIIHMCKEEFNALKYANVPFSLKDLSDKLKGKDARPMTIVAYLQEKVIELQSRVNIDITRATVQKYCRCIKHVQDFLLKFRNQKDFSISSMNSQFLMDFFYFLRSEKHNSHNTSINYIKCLKTVLMPLIKNGVVKTDPFLGLKLAPKQVNRGFLSLEEIKSIEALHDLSDGLDQVKDIFLFSCYTGMAYIDLKQFSARNLVKEADGTVCIHKARQKTGQLSIIPLLKPATRILEKYSITGDIFNFQWRVISNQKVNEHLKLIGKKAEINQELYFHLARHTFATTVTLTNGVPLETVSRMLGHTNIKMTQRYAKISGYKIKEDMKRVAHIFQ